ncbi:MAG: ABC transporter permease [Clostridia bacterium]|nr:ABC transporter permease [Clostridia bacterium]
MYIFKNALKSITRSKGRNILIGIILTVIAISSCVALSIRNSANELVQSYKDTYDISATLSLNRQSLRSDFKNSQGGSITTAPQDFMANIPAIDVDSVNKYGNSDYVKSYYYTIQTSLNSSNIEEVTSTSNSSSQGSFGGNFVIKQIDKQSGDFRLIGYSSEESMTQFVNGSYKITSGQLFDFNSTENTCIITDELAEANSLSVGSEIKLVNPNNESETYTFKVVGIYSDSSENTEEFSMFSSAANQILTNANVLNTIVTNSKVNEDTKLNEQISSNYNLKNADVIDAFTNELTSKGLSSYYTVSTNLDNFNESVKPLENISSFATVLLIIVLLVGGVILTILNMINIRERKYEIGVLRAIGMKKNKVLGQFLVELLVVTIISIMLGSVIGSVISVPVANNMLKNEIESQQSSQNQIDQNFGRSGGSAVLQSAGGQNKIMSMFKIQSQVDYIDKINAVIDAKVVLQLILIGLGLTIVSGSISMIFISRYTPLKILSSRT